jgi:hypothetical protein
VAENISFMEQVTGQLQSINEEGAEDRKATKGKGIQSSLLRDQIKILEVIANSVAMLNNNFEEFMQNQALANLKGLDPEDKGGVQGKTSGAKDSGDKDDSGFLFDGIIASFMAFKASMMLFGTRLLNFIKRIALPVTAVIALITGFMEDFESTEGTFGEKVVAGLGGAIQKLFKWLIAVPSQFVVDMAAWLARKMGADAMADYLERVDVVKMWEDLLGGIGEFLKPMTDMIAEGIDWFSSEEAAGFREAVSGFVEKIGNFIVSTAKVFAELLHFFTTGNELEAIQKIKEIYQAILDWFSELPKKMFDSLPEFAQAGLTALGFSPEAAYDPKSVSAGGRQDLTEELSDANDVANNNRTPPPTVIVAPQSSSTSVNSSTTNITASSGPVRDPTSQKMQGRGSHL